MDKFESSDAGRSMLTGESGAKTVISQEKSSRALWAVSMCSLIAVASLSCILVADRQRIAQLEAELASSSHNSRLMDSLNRPEVMQRVLALSQTSTSTKTVNVDLSQTKTTATSCADNEILTEEQNHQIIDAFSTSLHDTLLLLDQRITTVNSSWASSQTDITQLQTDVDELFVSTDDIKINVTTLMNNYDDLNAQVDDIQTQVDTLNAAYGDHEGKESTFETRLTKLEGDAVVIRTDVDQLYIDTQSIQDEITGVQDYQADLQIQVDDIHNQVDTLEGVFG